MTLPFLCLYLCSFILSTTAANDWNKPCFSGVCEYDIPSANGLSSGTLKIWGTSNTIGDITPAAGWVILSCSPDSLKQTIRIACMDESSSDCEHLFGYTSNPNNAVGKVVRLPETCGVNAFGIITKTSLDEDQSIPANMIRSLTRRDGTLPTVHGLHISTNPSAAKDGQKVYFTIRGTSISGDPPTPMPQNDIIQGRGLRSSIKHGVKHLLNEAESINDFLIQNSNLSSVDFNQNLTVANETIFCAETDSRAKITISLETKTHADMYYYVLATGTIIPPKIDSISLAGNITAIFDAIIGLTANVSGTMDIAEIKLFQFGLPGLNFPGILSIGPSFEIISKGTVALATPVDMKLGLNFSINQTSFNFPEYASGGGSFQLQGEVIKVDVGQNGNTTGTVALHLIPSLNFGIDAFGNLVETKVFLNVDASVSATIEVLGTGSEQLPRDEPIPPLRFDRKSDLANDPSIAVCFQFDAGLSVNVGADSEFFNLFDATTQIALYNNTFSILKKKCPSIVNRRELEKKSTFSLQCLPLPRALISIID